MSHKPWINTIANAIKDKELEAKEKELTDQEAADQEAAQKSYTPEEWDTEFESFQATLAEDARRQQLEEEARAATPVNIYGNAFEMQQALTGVYGPAAQAQAIGQYQESPGVSALRDAGMKSIEGEASITGQGGGSRLKAISKFNQDLASQDYGNWYNRLGGITGVNVTAANAAVGVGTAAGVGQSNIITSQGDNRANAILSRPNTMGSTLGDLGSLYAYNQGRK